MNKEFVPYQEALELKELGFDEPCFAVWTRYDMELHPTPTWVARPRTPHIDAPLYQQTFRWFEDKHSLYVSRDVICNSNEILDIEYAIDSWRIGRNGVIFENPQDCFDTDKARLACLKKLIEIVKNGNI
jgi:hypothetical protein